MLERRSALPGFHGATERPGVDGTIGLAIGEVAGWSLVEIGVYPSKRVDGERAIEAWIGKLPERIDTPATTRKGLLMRTGPLSFWLLGPAGSDNARTARTELPESVISVIDLSSSRTRLYILGAPASGVLLKGFPIDLAPESFPAGSIALTGVHHTPILLYRAATDRFEILAMRTFALTVFEWLTDAALEFGYRVRHTSPGDDSNAL